MRGASFAICSSVRIFLRAISSPLANVWLNRLPITAANIQLTVANRWGVFRQDAMAEISGF